jgi:hypothetical protein
MSNGYHRGVVLGRGAHGTVFASVSPEGSKVAVKEYHNYADGVFALRAITDIADILGELARRHIAVAVSVKTEAPVILVMPIATRPPDSWWKKVVQLANTLLELGVVMSDIKPTNLGVLNEHLVLLDVEAISRPQGKFTGFGSYPVICSQRWGHRQGGAAAYAEMASMLETDYWGNVALTKHAALCTAAEMANAPLPLSSATVAFLDCEDVSAMWGGLQSDMRASALFKEAQSRGACLL